MYDAISGISHAYCTILVTTMRKWEYYSTTEGVYIYIYSTVVYKNSQLV